MTVMEDFLRVPKHVYEKDPFYIQEDRKKVLWQLSEQNEVFARNQVFLECSPKRGRLAGFYHDGQMVAGKRAGFFGFFESLEDKSFCRRIFQKFELWAKNQGAQVIFGPLDLTTYGRYRVRFAHKKIQRPFTGEPYNPYYYPQLLEDAGYKVYMDYYSLFSKSRYLALLMTKWKARKKPLPPNLTILPLSYDLWSSHTQEISNLLHEIFKNNFAYQKISFSVFKEQISKTVLRLMDPYTSFLVRDDRCGKIVAITISLPDYAKLSYQGALDPIKEGIIQYKTHRALLKKTRLLGKTFGVLEDYRKLGLYNHMMHQVAKNAKDYDTFVGCLARGGNQSMTGITAPHEKVRYGLYYKMLS